MNRTKKSILKFFSGITATELCCFALCLLAMAAFHLLVGWLTAGGTMMAMAAVSTTNPTDFADRTQTLFNPKLLKALQFNLKLAGYGLSEGYKAIGTTIRFFRPRKANTVGVNAEAARTTSLSITKLVAPTALVEGVTPTTLTEVKIGYIDIPMYQQGGIATITDKLQAIDLLNTLQVYSTTMGADAALDYDTVIRDTLISGVANSNALYVNATNDGGYFERFAGVVNSGVSAADHATLNGLTKNNGRINRGVSLGVVTQLATAKISKIGGNYVAVTPPQVTHDIRQDELWLRAATFQDKNNLYKDLDVMLDGVAYVRANNPFVEAANYLTESATDPGDGLIYNTIFLGADAFGLPSLSNKRAGSGTQAPQIVVLDKADKSDALNQKTVIGWKSMFGAGPFIASSRNNEIGDVPRYVILRSKSTFI